MNQTTKNKRKSNNIRIEFINNVKLCCFVDDNKCGFTSTRNIMELKHVK